MIHEGNVFGCVALGVESLEVCKGNREDVKLPVHVVRDACDKFTDVFGIIIIITNMCHTNAASAVDDGVIPTVDRGSLRIAKGAGCVFADGADLPSIRTAPSTAATSTATTGTFI